MNNAVYPLYPLCPECFQALSRPTWWLSIKDKKEDWTRPLTVHCPNCESVVVARFFGTND